MSHDVVSQLVHYILAATLFGIGWLFRYFVNSLLTRIKNLEGEFIQLRNEVVYLQARDSDRNGKFKSKATGGLD